MPKKFTPGQCVRIISVDDESVFRRYPDIKEHIGETGDIESINPNSSGNALGDIEPITEDIYCNIKLHQSKQIIRVPVEALEPC